MQIQTQIDIDAPPERVWAVLTDFERYPDWNPFLPEIRGEAREGARLVARLTPPGGTPATFKPTVTEVEPDRQLTWLGKLLGSWLFAGEHTFRLEPLSGDRTRFHHGESYQGVLVPFLRKSLDTHTRRGFEQMNEALKTVSEHP